MSDVVDLAAERARRNPHTAGQTLCLGCGHEWVAVMPLGGPGVIECPACKAEKGVRAGLVFRNEPHWTCTTPACDRNQYLHITASGAYCPGCGEAWGWDELAPSG